MIPNKLYDSYTTTKFKIDPQQEGYSEFVTIDYSRYSIEIYSKHETFPETGKKRIISSLDFSNTFIENVKIDEHFDDPDYTLRALILTRDIMVYRPNLKTTTFKSCMMLVMIDKSGKVLTNVVDADFSSFNGVFMDFFREKEYLDTITFSDRIGNKPIISVNIDTLFSNIIETPDEPVLSYDLEYDFSDNLLSNININDYTIRPKQFLDENATIKYNEYLMSYTIMTSRSYKSDLNVGILEYKYGTKGITIHCYLNVNREYKKTEGYDDDYYVYKISDVPDDILEKYISISEDELTGVEDEIFSYLESKISTDLNNLIKTLCKDINFDTFSIISEGNVSVRFNETSTACLFRSKDISFEMINASFIMNCIEIDVNSLSLNGEFLFNVSGGNIINVSDMKSIGKISFYSYTQNDVIEDPSIGFSTENDVMLESPIFLDPSVKLSFFNKVKDRNNGKKCDVHATVLQGTLYRNPKTPRINIVGFETSSAYVTVDKYVSASKILRFSDVLKVNIVDYVRYADFKTDGSDITVSKADEITVESMYYKLGSDAKLDETKLSKGNILSVISCFTGLKISLYNTNVIFDKTMNDFSFMKISKVNNVEFRILDTTISSKLSLFSATEEVHFKKVYFNKSSFDCSRLVESDIDKLFSNNSNLFFTKSVKGVNAKEIYLNKSNINASGNIEFGGEETTTFNIEESAIYSDGYFKAICSKMKSIFNVSKSYIQSRDMLHVEANIVTFSNSTIYTKKLIGESQSGRYDGVIRTSKFGKLDMEFSGGSSNVDLIIGKQDKNYTKEISVNVNVKKSTNLVSGSFSMKPVKEDEETVLLYDVTQIDDIPLTIISDDIDKIKINFLTDSKSYHNVSLNSKAELLMNTPKKSVIKELGVNKFKIEPKPYFDYS